MKGFKKQRGSSREQGYSDLEAATIEARAQKPSAEQIQRKKDKAARRAAKKTENLNSGVQLSQFSPDIDPETRVSAPFSLKKALYEAALGTPETERLMEIEESSSVRIIRANDLTLLFRGLPGNIIKAQRQIQADLVNRSPPSPVLQ